MNHGQDQKAVVRWEEHSAIGHHYGELRADGMLDSWTEPPIRETRFPGEDGPDHNPICQCPGQRPRAFRFTCADCAGCGRCPCPPAMPCTLT
ncbi:hypothetical protein [Streptomyces sp. MNP-20]|uniref:hypothetical protein n=1 Tax=Streptomyces sp. MNP-20 TaxID=2721165 RepID=UPI00155703CA|nr:hypothetical protein [Streptomyces sp. MNP-20]